MRTAAMTPTSERICMTTILVKNIHCASCVSTIKELLAEWRGAIRHVEVNTLSLEVQITHAADLNVLRVCAALSDAAFEVHSAVSMDEKGYQIQELEFASGDNDWFDRLGGPNYQSFDRRDHNTSRTSLTKWRLSTARKHAQNCEACRQELEAKEKGLRQSTHFIEDLERGDLGMRRSADRALLSVSKQTLVTDDEPATPTVPSVTHSVEGKYEAILSIGGMTCSSCTSAVSQGVSELAFVDLINVNLMTNSATVVFTDESNLQKIVDAIEDLGYDCTVDTYRSLDRNNSTSSEVLEGGTKRNVLLKIEGMFCQHCPEKVLAIFESLFPDSIEVLRLPTMQDPILSISYTPHPPSFTIRDIVRSINAVDDSFTAEVYTPPSIEQRSQAMQRQEQRRLLIRLLFATAAAIPTFLIGVVWMSLVSKNNSIRIRLEKPALAGSATGFEWALFFLATPVMFFAADVFHLRAIKEVRALWRPGSKVPILRRFYRFGSMNLLISAGTSVAYFSSIAILALDASTKNIQHASNSAYFDSVVFLTFFILMGRWLEAYSKAKTGNAVAMLRDLRPEKALLITRKVDDRSSSIETNVPKSDATETAVIDANLLEVNDVVLIQHGSSPPSDGVVSQGSTTFDESSLTGEARAVKKEEGDKVFAGTINTGAAVRVQVTELSGASVLDQIVSVVREGQSKRAPVERVVDVVTGYFVPAITALAIITFLIWVSLGYSGALNPRYIESQQGGWAFWSLEFAIAVFVVACPCGIGLAAPTALFVGSGLAAERGILVRGGGEAFQEASKVDCMVFDKTGTLTEGGDLSVTDHELLVEGAEAEIAWTITWYLEQTSSHPLARAILRFVNGKAHNEEVSVDSIVEEPGMGLRGTFTTPTGQYEAALGSERSIQSLAPTPPLIDYFTTTTLSRWKSEAKSVALLALRPVPTKASPTDSTTPDDEQQQYHQQPKPWTLALITAIADPIRPSAIPTIAALRDRGIAVYMLTGDNAITASAVASTLSIPQDHVFAGVLPTEKADRIRWLQEHFFHSDGGGYTASAAVTEKTNDVSDVNGKTKGKGKKKKRATVAFVGDGINDAPALTAANVSVSFAAATDVAVQAASFVILSSSSSSPSSVSASNVPGHTNTTHPGTNTNINKKELNDPLPALPPLLALSRRVFRRVQFNFGWALVYNVILIPVAAGCLFWVGTTGHGGGGAGGTGGTGGTGWRLGPVWGSAAMAGSSLCVVASSAALRVQGRWEDWWRRRRS